MAKKNWIPKHLHKGRCTPMGTAKCPPGSPQYNLAKTFKKHHGFHKKENGGCVDCAQKAKEQEIKELKKVKSKLPKRKLGCKMK